MIAMFVNASIVNEIKNIIAGAKIKREAAVRSLQTSYSIMFFKVSDFLYH